ncbi:MAG TPA: DNA polymerase ligase N-terminal domain-containing protein [Acidimicrobiales bacterium]|nr:DNA polymerase ligase N-terminal domain-containing protein [Acidimicrobiales bacterium]
MPPRDQPSRPPLGDYRSKRHFDRTPEPTGAAPAGDLDDQRDGAAERMFVVQLHRARRRHYDFRLEVDGVLASWAMPKGPTLDPGVRALAVHVEDHPLEYREFEGVIPAGEYGGGDVIVWDRGTWVPARTEDPAAAVASGELHFDLTGEKLRGRFVLVRTRAERGKEQWLMLHKHDEWAVPGWSPDDHPASVKSGRTNDEVRAEPAAVWHSDRPVAEAEETLGAAAAYDAPTEDELEALDRLGPEGRWVLQGRELKLTNLDKILFPGRPGEDPVTKRDLVRYNAVTAPLMLPYLAGRPVNLHRYPNGSDRPGFWHKQVPDFAPDWLSTWDYPDAGPGDSERYFVLDSVPALAWMANYGALELHPWTSKVPDVRQPTWALIDIDPGANTTPDEVLVLARLFQAGLEHLRVQAVAKVTGQRGVHIWIPVVAGYTFHDTSDWVEKLSKAVGATVPDLVSWTWQKSARQGRARLDYTQNAINKTLVAPYSTRPAAGAPVSAPISWEDLSDPGLRSDTWTIRSLPARVAEVGDLWAGIQAKAQKLPAL